nr:prefoldin subunit 2 [Chelonoidis abingdonii]
MADSGQEQERPDQTSSHRNSLTATAHYPTWPGPVDLQPWLYGLHGVWRDFSSVCLSHSLVIDTLRDVDPTRKCYRMVGGVLVERTVKEVLPALESNKEQINKIIETLTQQLQAKGQELNEFREKHNIRVMGEDDQKPPPKESADGAGAKTSSAGVLVS